MYITIFPLLCPCTPCIHCLRRPEKGTGSHETRVEEGCEQSWLPEIKHEFSRRIVLFWAIAPDFLPFLVCLLLLQFCSLGILMIICCGNVFLLSCLFVVLNCSCLWMSTNFLIFGGDFSIISLNNFFMSLHFIFGYLSYSIDNFFLIWTFSRILGHCNHINLFISCFFFVCLCFAYEKTDTPQHISGDWQTGLPMGDGWIFSSIV